AGPSAPEAAPASDHQRWPVSFQALTRVARRPAPASDGAVVATVVTAGRLSIRVLGQRPPCIAGSKTRPRIPVVMGGPSGPAGGGSAGQCEAAAIVLTPGVPSGSPCPSAYG